MSHHQVARNISYLEKLPAELLNIILGELVGTENKASQSTYRGNKPWPKRVHNAPSLSTAILRTNKNIHGIAKSYLDDANKWIIIDMDHIFLLLPWICTTIPLFVVDPETDSAIPDGVLHMRVKLQLSLHHKEIGLMPSWPQSVPSRQTIILPLDHFGAFLSHLRTVELMYGIHLTPNVLMWINGETIRVWQGYHGMSIRVHVKPGAKEVVVQPLLEALRKFHGPLNEVSIVNPPNSQSARDIEKSITAQPGTFIKYECFTHVVKLITLSTDLISDRRWRLARSVSNQAVGGLTNMTGFMSMTPNVTLTSFELLILQLPYLNSIIFDLQFQRPSTYSEIASRFTDPGRWTDGLLDVQNKTIELHAWVHLVYGLVVIFVVRYQGMELDPSAQILTVQTGMEGVEYALNLFAHLPTKNSELMDCVGNMMQELQRLDNVSDQAQKMLTIVNLYGTLLADTLARYYQPVRWLVPESMISEELVSQGMLGYMTKESEMTTAEANRYTIMKAFQIDSEEEGQDGEWYCL